MPLPQAHKDNFTIDYIYTLPDGKRAELIDGNIYYMAPPTRKHQRIVGKLYRIIADYIDRNNGRCEVNIAPFAVFLNADQRNYVEPDITVVCDSNKLSDKGCTGSPDWIIEVVSPASRRMDYMIKLFKYRTAGVREYWIVDDERQRVTVYDLENENVEEYTFADVISVKIYDDLKIDFCSLGIE